MGYESDMCERSRYALEYHLLQGETPEVVRNYRGTFYRVVCEGMLSGVLEGVCLPHKALDDITCVVYELFGNPGIRFIELKNDFYSPVKWLGGIPGNRRLTQKELDDIKENAQWRRGRVETALFDMPRKVGQCPACGAGDNGRGYKGTHFLLCTEYDSNGEIEYYAKVICRNCRQEGEWFIRDTSREAREEALKNWKCMEVS